MYADSFCLTYDDVDMFRREGISLLTDLYNQSKEVQLPIELSDINVEAEKPIAICAKQWHIFDNQEQLNNASIEFKSRNYKAIIIFLPM